MKRSVQIFAAILLGILMLSPMSAYAATYNISDTDITLRVDDTMWYVFTRDNLDNNPELDELGLTYQEMYDILYNNNAYMDAILFYVDGEYVELFVRKTVTDAGVAQLTNYSEKEMLSLAEELKKQANGEATTSIYETQYKFVRMEYYDADAGYNMCQFFTVVNRDVYAISFQATSPFTEEEYEEIAGIVDSIRFEVDTSLKENMPRSFASEVLKKTISGALFGGIGGAVIALVAALRNRKKKSAVNVNASTDYNYNYNNSSYGNGDYNNGNYDNTNNGGHSYTDNDNGNYANISGGNVSDNTDLNNTEENTLS